MLDHAPRQSWLFALLLLVAVALPTSARAQTSPTSQAAATSTGPRVLAIATWGVETHAPVVAAPQSRPNAGKDIAMMVAGGAALVVGAIVGGNAGTIIMIGGGAIGIIGLYHYLK